MDEVENAVIALEKGQKLGGNVLSLIQLYEIHSTDDTTYSQDGRAINERYKAYLNAAYTTAADIADETGDVTQDKEKMEAAKEAI